MFLVAVVTLRPFAEFADTDASIATLIALLVALIPTTIGALLSAIGIAGMDRLVRRNVLALSGRAVEASGDVDVLLLDKTGTITLGNREATEFVPMPGVERARARRGRADGLARRRDPEGRSIVVLAKQYGIREHELADHERELRPLHRRDPDERRRPERHAGCARARATRSRHSSPPRAARRRRSCSASSTGSAREGGTPLAVARDSQVLGVIYLKDVVKEGMRDALRPAARDGHPHGDGHRRQPADRGEDRRGVGRRRLPRRGDARGKMTLIRSEQEKGRLVAMTGDGTNDAPALAQADVGVAMNTGTQAAREAGNMVDLDSNPTKLIEIVEVGKQLLITRGALTTFSIANDVAKYFAILPAIFAATYAAAGERTGPLDKLNIMNLGTPESAIISAIVFNALDHPAAGPARPARRPLPADRRDRAAAPQHPIYGLGGLIAPFIGIKLVDLLVHNVLGA